MLDPVRSPGIVTRHPELRWLLSAVLIVTVVATVSASLAGVFRQSTSLAVTGPQQLVAQIRSAHVGGYSGTIVAQSDLGLPVELKNVVTAAGAAGNLLRGSHTMRYWYGGADRQRVAVISQSSEQDMFRSGNIVWEWDTATRVARRHAVPAAQTGPLPLLLESSADLTPPQLASSVLALLGSDTDIALRSGDDVADRAVYELVVRPESASSLIGEVHIEVDGRQAVPLGVQVYPANGDDPVLDVAFTAINFTPPAEQNFHFTPPPGATVRSGAQPAASALGEVTVLGTGWATVLEYGSRGGGSAEVKRLAGTLLGESAQRVSGTWGNGRLLQTPALSVLMTDRGRLVVGPVTPDVLYHAVG